LGEVPLGFYQDESAIGYNAYSILQTGKDEYGKTFPLYFKSFGDYKLPVYIYSVVPSIKLFGLNEFAVRFPSALFGFLTVVVSYFFIKQLTKNKLLALVTTLLIGINPWSLHYNRATFEVSMSLFFFVAGSFLLYNFFVENKKGALLFGTLSFLVALYSYNLTRLLAPLFFILCVWAFRKKNNKQQVTEEAITAILSLILLIPFVVSFFQGGGLSSAKGTLIFSSNAVLAPLLEFRSYFVSGSSFFSSLFFNSHVLLFWQYIQNVISYLSVQFFFISGSTHGNHGIGDVGQMYLFEFLFFLWGVVAAIRKNFQNSYFLLAWAVITILVASLTREIPHATRSFFLILPFEVFSAYGLIEFVSFLKKASYKNVGYALLAILVGFNLVYYFSSYYVRFPILYAKAWRFEDKEVSLFIAKNQSKYSKIIFDDDAGFIYTSLLFYSQYSPSQFQDSVVRSPDDSEGFTKVLSFGKYEFKKVDWKKDYAAHNVLIITAEENKPKEVASLQAFYYPPRPVVLSVREQIMQYPIRETAYVAVATK